MKRTFLALICFLFTMTHAFPASNVVVTPDSMDMDSRSLLTVTAGVASGSNIKIFIVADFNGDEVKNGADLILQYHQLTEGAPPIVPGSPKPGDEDGLNAHLQTTIDFWSEFLIAGEYIVIVKDSGSEASATLTINQPSTAQSVSGVVVDSSDNPIPGFVIAIDENDNEQIIQTNENGEYTLNLPAGDYYIGAIVFGYITDFDGDSVQMASLNPGENLTNIQLKVYNGDFTVSGNVSSSSGPGVPYMLVTAEILGGAQDMESFAMTDANGDFQIPINEGFWEIILEESVLNQRGLSGPSWDEINITGNVSNFDFILEDADTYISGTVTKKNDASPVIACPVYAQSGERCEIAGMTRAPDGSFVFLVKGGDDWWVNVEEDFIFKYQYVLPQARMVSPTAGNPATNVNFELEEPSSFIEAEVKESGTNDPVSDVEVWVNDQNWNFMGGKQTNDEGKALFGVSPGEYNVGLASSDVYTRGYILPPSQNISVGTSDTVKATFILVPATASVEGTVTHNDAPVSGVFINLMNDDFGWMGNAQTSGEGYYKLLVNPGTYYVQPEGGNLIQRGIAPTPIQQIVAEEGVNVLDFDLQSPNAVINVHILGEGAPLDNIGTFVQPITEPYFPLAMIRTDATGKAAYNITNGTYDVGMFWHEVEDAGFIPRQNQRVTVSEDETLDVNFHLRPDSSKTAIDAILKIFDLDDFERDFLDKNHDGRLDVADVIFMLLQGK